MFISPEVVTGLPLTTMELPVLVTPTRVTVPPPLAPPEVLIVTAPVEPDIAIPVPATMLVTPVLVTVMGPGELGVIGLLDTEMPDPAVSPTLVTPTVADPLLIEVTIPLFDTVTMGFV